MFGAVPPQEQWVYGKAELADGRVVDLLRGGRPLERERPSGGFISLANHRWHKYFWILPRPRIRVFGPPTAAALVRDWNSRHSAAEQVRSFEIRFAVQGVGATDAPQQDMLVAAWPPRGPDGEGNLDRLAASRPANCPPGGRGGDPTHGVDSRRRPVSRDRPSRESGETGRRAGFRFQCRKACGFDSRLSHSTLGLPRRSQRVGMRARSRETRLRDGTSSGTLRQAPSARILTPGRRRGNRPGMTFSTESYAPFPQPGRFGFGIERNAGHSADPWRRPVVPTRFHPLHGPPAEPGPGPAGATAADRCPPGSCAALFGPPTRRTSCRLRMTASAEQPRAAARASRRPAARPAPAWRRGFGSEILGLALHRRLRWLGRERHRARGPAADSSRRQARRRTSGVVGGGIVLRLGQLGRFGTARFLVGARNLRLRRYDRSRGLFIRDWHDALAGPPAPLCLVEPIRVRTHGAGSDTVPVATVAVMAMCCGPAGLAAAGTALPAATAGRLHGVIHDGLGRAPVGLALGLPAGRGHGPGLPGRVRGDGRGGHGAADDDHRQREETAALSIPGLEQEGSVVNMVIGRSSSLAEGR